MTWEVAVIYCTFSYCIFTVFSCFLGCKFLQDFPLSYCSESIVHVWRMFLCKEKAWQQDSRKWGLQILLVLEFTRVWTFLCLTWMQCIWKFSGSSVGISVYQLTMFSELKKPNQNNKSKSSGWWMMTVNNVWIFWLIESQSMYTCSYMHSCTFQAWEMFPIFALSLNHCVSLIQSSIFMLSSMEFMDIMNMGNKVRTLYFKVTLDEGF